MTTLAQKIDEIVNGTFESTVFQEMCKGAIYACVEEALKMEPTMGQWDDFCAVFPVPFDEFMKAYRAMRSAQWKEIEEGRNEEVGN
jgi:hypothetical protein